MCEGGAVEEWLAVDLRDTGSRLACVNTVFNRCCAADIKLSLWRNT
jgi:hypothetical protein